MGIYGIRVFFLKVNKNLLLFLREIGIFYFF